MKMKFTFHTRRVLAIAAGDAVTRQPQRLRAAANRPRPNPRPPPRQTPATADIRDIRGPKHIPSPWLWPAWLAGGLALSGARLRRLALESSSRSRHGEVAV